MGRNLGRGATALGAICLTAAVAVMSGTAPAAMQNARWGADYFPNVTLTTQDGVKVRFYDDLVKGKIVAINLIYTTCKYACPLETARLAQVQRLLGDRMGRDVFFYSITIDPEIDTPPVLKKYAEQFRAGPGWLFLTGTKEDVELISRKIGIYSPPNPANPDGHKPHLLIGNEATGQWVRNSGLDNAGYLANTIGNWLNSWQTARKTTRSYADAPKINLDPGEYTFKGHCAACHTIGGGDQIGPDLLGVTARRDPAWLKRIILTPDKLIAEKDPIAMKLLGKYKQVRMPTLGLADADAAVLIEYLGRAKAPAAATTATSVAPAKSVAPAASAAPAATAAALQPLIDPYLRMQRSLNRDGVAGVAEAARAIAGGAATLGPAAEGIRTAALAFRPGADLTGARAAFGRLGDAMLRYASQHNAEFGADVKVAYCPMLSRYWLQRGEAVQNPFYGRSMSDCGRIVAKVPVLN
jgi:protein SCO1